MSSSKWGLIVLLAAILLIVAPSHTAFACSGVTVTSTGVSSGQAVPNNPFTTDVLVSASCAGTAADPGVGAIELYIGYDPAVIQPDPALPPPADPATLGVAFFGTPTPIVGANVQLPAASCPGGAMPCAHIIVAGAPQTNRSATLVARLRWKALATGNAGITILNPVNTLPPNFAAPRSELRNSDGYVIPINSVNIAPVTITNPGYIQGIVQRQGVPPNPGNGTLGCTQVEARLSPNVGSVPAFTKINNTAGAFTYTVPNVPAGYSVIATYPGYLPSMTNTTVAAGATVQISCTRLLGGNVVDDVGVNTPPVIDIRDIVAIINALGTSGGVRSDPSVCAPIAGTQGIVPPNTLPVDLITDINDDGVVDVGDLAISAGNFGVTGPTTWGGCQ